MTRAKAAPLLAGCVVLAALALGISLRPRAPEAAPPDIGGGFTLADGEGRTVTSASFQGFWRLMYFGYTHCPDACPATLGTLAAALDKLPPPARARVRVLFVTVDPARDTPAVMGAYVKAFGPEFVGLTGSQAALAPVLEDFHVYAKRAELSGGDYAMDHSSVIYVMAPDGHFAGLLDDSMTAAMVAEKLKGLGA